MTSKNTKKKTKWIKDGFEEAERRAVKINRQDFMKWLRKMVKRDWGVRCPEFSDTCPCCCAWEYYDICKHSFKKR